MWSTTYIDTDHYSHWKVDSRRLKLWCTSVVEQCLTVGDCWSAIVLSISKVNFELFFVSRRITIFIPREKSHQLRMFEAFQTESKAFLFPSLLQRFQTSHFKCIFVVVIFFSQYYFEAGGLNSLNCLLLLFGQWAVEGHADIFGPAPNEKRISLKEVFCAYSCIFEFGQHTEFCIMRYHPLNLYVLCVSSHFWSRCSRGMTRSQMMRRTMCNLPAKFWRLVGRMH